ncbi:hypothetical protein KC19_3G243300 [Ceratodon purpureus]|uniref:Uncharacterized protein n=1 Tax=Ceratodon purpureus TaxID=3225 RepID=A0A8T0IR85_CERPU|nr:hypothetical protein KC19_3G243300 [Ceratodon purpureus]
MPSGALYISYYFGQKTPIVCCKLSKIEMNSIKLLIRRQNLLKIASRTKKIDHGIREFHTSKQNELHASKNQMYSNDYIHAETMYNLTAMTGRNVKFGALVWGGVATGIFVPLIACSFQQRKAKGG